LYPFFEKERPTIGSRGTGSHVRRFELIVVDSNWRAGSQVQGQPLNLTLALQMRKKLKQHIIEGMIILAIVGMVISIVFRIIKPETLSNHYNNWHNEFPILSSVLYIIILLPLTWVTYTDLVNPEEKTKGLDVYRLILFAGSSIYFILKLFNNLHN